MKSLLFLFITCCSVTLFSQDKSDYQFFMSLDYLAADKDKQVTYKSEFLPRLHFASIANFHAAYSMDEDILNSSEGERRRILELLVPHYKITDTETQDIVLKNTLDLIEFTKVDSKEELNNFLETKIKQKDPHEKVLFLGNLLSTLADNYDFKSLEDDFDEVKIDDMEMVGAMRSLLSTGKELPVGVCRHMHQFALRVAKRIGMENSFGVGYNTTSGSHRTLVLNIPGKRDEVVQLNYGEMTTVTGKSGISTLTQNHSIPSSGIRFSLYNGNDKAAIVLPSEDGSILNLVTGGDDSDLGAGHKDDSQISQIGVNTPYGTFRVFSAGNSISSLESLQGMAINKTFNFGDIYTQKIGLSGFQSKRVLGDQNIYETTGVFLNSTSEINYKIYTSKSLSLKAFNKLHLRLSIYCSGRDYDKCVKNEDIHISDQYGVELKYQNEKVTNITTIMAESQMATRHASFSGKQGIISPAMSFSNKLQVNYNNDIYSEHNFDLVHYNLAGSKFNVVAIENAFGVRSHDAKLYHRYQRSVDKSAPIWLPGAEEKSEIGLQKSFLNKRLKLSGSYTEYETIPGGNAGLSIQFFTN